jgi:flagellin
MLLRMKTLATQGYNGSLDSKQRTDLVDELQQLNAEIVNTSSRTKYNGNVLIANESGWTGGTNFGTAVYASNAAAAAASKTFGSAAAAGADVGFFSAISTSGADIGTYTFSQGTTATKLALSNAVGKSQELTLDAIASGGSQTLDFSDLGIKVTISAGAAGFVAATGVTELTGTTLTIAGSNPTNQFQAGPDVSSYITYQSINVKTDGTTGSDSRMNAVGTMLTSGNLYTYAAASRNTNTDTAGASWDAAFNTMVSNIDSAVQFISERRSVIGAQINRISYISTNLQAQSTNLQSSRSAIIDTDFAAETAKLTKGQIMQQAATAMLAQANQMPNVVLSLLK